MKRNEKRDDNQRKKEGVSTCVCEIIACTICQSVCLSKCFLNSFTLFRDFLSIFCNKEVAKKKQKLLCFFFCFFFIIIFFFFIFFATKVKGGCKSHAACACTPFASHAGRAYLQPQPPRMFSGAAGVFIFFKFAAKTAGGKSVSWTRTTKRTEMSETSRAATRAAVRLAAYVPEESHYGVYNHNK